MRRTHVLTNNIDFSLGGLILDYTISSYKGIAVFQLVINGVGGNLVAVQASRISTSLHKDYHTGVQGSLNVCISPIHAFFDKGKFVKNTYIQDIIASSLIEFNKEFFIQEDMREQPEYC